MNLRLVGLTVIIAIGAEQEIQAYTDPGSGALIWQMAVAGFVGSLFYVRRFVSWLRGRKQ